MSGPGQHSPVGASSIKRGLICSLSVDLAAGIEDEESEHAALGTATHALIEHCFRTNTDGWNYIGKVIGDDGGIRDGEEAASALAFGKGLVVDRKMSLGAQVMLDAVRKAHPDRNQANFFVERRFHCPTIHRLFFGTSDVVYLETPEGDMLVLHIWDYKNGVMLVEVEEHEQGMYYACGALEDLGLWGVVDKVIIHIVQPNGFHSDGPVRQWETTTEHLVEWLEDVCIPGMERATNPAMKKTAVSGDHCVFCPVRSHACPQLMSDMDELEVLLMEAQKNGADALTNEQVGRLLALWELGKIVGKAAGSTAFKRIQGGGRVPGYKLVQATGHRVWKEGAEEAAKVEFGGQAYSTPELKSPAQIEELPLGTDFAARHASKPINGLKLTKASDSKPEVSTDTKSLFTDVTKKSASVTADAPMVVEGLVLDAPPVAVRRKKAA